MALVNQYIFDNNTNDRVGGNTGTAGGSPAPSAVLGRFHRSSGKSAYDFPGGHDGSASANNPRITLTRTSFEYTDTSNFSLLAWVRFDASNVYQTIFANIIDGSNGHTLLWLRGDTNKLQFQVEDPGNDSAIATSTGTYNDGNWHMVVATWNGSTKTATININNGADTASDTDTSVGPGANLFSTSAQANIGAWLSLTSTYKYDLDGQIGLFENYNHVLTAAEIRAKYLEGKSMFLS